MVTHYIYVHYDNQIEQVVMNEPYSEKVFARFAGKQLLLRTHNGVSVWQEVTVIEALSINNQLYKHYNSIRIITVE